jgi:hypothetical protein
MSCYGLKRGPRSNAAIPITSLRNLLSSRFNSEDDDVINNNEIIIDNNNYEDDDGNNYFFEETIENNGNDEQAEEFLLENELGDDDGDDDITLYEEETFVDEINAFTNDHSDELIGNFVKQAMDYAKASNSYNSKGNNDNELRFESNSDSKCTVSEFARKFYNISATHGFTKVAMLDILNLFDQCTCNLNLPLKKKKKIIIFLFRRSSERRKRRRRTTKRFIKIIL